MCTRSASLVVLVVVMAVVVSIPVFAAPSVDQQQPTIDDSVGGLAIDPEEKLAQVFTVGVNGNLVELGLPIACSTGDLILEVQGVAASGQPDGVMLWAQTYAGAGLPSFFPDPPALRPFVLSVPLPVAVGQQLAVVMSSPGQCAVFQGPLGDPYAGGDAWFDARPNPPGWLPLTEGLLPADYRFDLPFETVVENRRDVDIDFKPWDARNLIIPWRPGPVAVAVLSEPGFDATTVDETTASLGPAGAPAFGPGWSYDVDGDGDTDRVLWFDVRATGIVCGDTTVTLLASTTGGVEIRGVDPITTIGCRRR